MPSSFARAPLVSATYQIPPSPNASEAAMVVAVVDCYVFVFTPHPESGIARAPSIRRAAALVMVRGMDVADASAFMVSRPPYR